MWDLALTTGVITSGIFALGVGLQSGFGRLRQRKGVLLTAGVGLSAGAMIVADSLLSSGKILADDTASAGADWLAVHDGWVDTYELSEVDVEAEVVPNLVLTDSAGRTIRIGLVVLQSHPALWDLVYNGIMHSTRQGAVASARARTKLQLGGA